MNSILVQVKMMIQMMKVGLDLSVLVFLDCARYMEVNKSKA